MTRLVWEEEPLFPVRPRVAIGYSGSRLGMRPWQKDRFREILIERNATELHHGDCAGGDQEAHVIGRELGLWIVGHPPTANGLRAFCDFDEERQPLPFLARNHMIVRETIFLVAAPAGPAQLRSGTWATVRFCRKHNHPHEVMDGNGKR